VVRKFPVLGGHSLCKEISTEQISISIPISYVPLLRDAYTQIHVTRLQWCAKQASPARSQSLKFSWPVITKREDQGVDGRMESEWILVRLAGV
jgi:hypothetical protein